MAEEIKSINSSTKEDKTTTSTTNIFHRPKCPMCGRKANHLDITCKCGKQFCMEHFLPEYHNCTFNHKEDGIKKLIKQLNY